MTQFPAGAGRFSDDEFFVENQGTTSVRRILDQRLEAPPHLERGNRGPQPGSHIQGLRLVGPARSSECVLNRIAEDRASHAMAYIGDDASRLN